MKNLSYAVAFLVAGIMAFFQAWKEPDPASIALLFSINLTGVFLFIFASRIPETERFTPALKMLPSWLMLAGAIIVRAYTFVYIAQVYSGNGMWHLITVNVILVFCEVGIFFYGEPDKEAAHAKKTAREWEVYARGRSNLVVELEEKNRELSMQISQLTAQLKPMKGSQQTTKKSKKSAQPKRMQFTGMNSQERYEAVHSFLSLNPGTSQNKTAEHFGVSSHTIKPYMQTNQA